MTAVVAPIADLVAVCTRLGELDVDTMDRAELSEMVSVATAMRSALDALEVRCARRRRELETHGTADSSSSLFGRTGRRSAKEAGRIDERTDTVEALPSFEDALAAGVVAAEHVDALTVARRGLDADARAVFDTHEHELREHAARDGVDAFSRRCRRLARTVIAAQPGSDAEELDRQRANSKIRRWIDKSTGMCHTHAELDPVRDAALWGAIDAHLATVRQQDGNARTPWQQLQVRAFLAAIEQPAAGGNGANGSSTTGTAAMVQRVPEINVLVDLATLQDGVHDHSVCETDNGVPLPLSTVRRLCCEADVIPIVLDGAGQPLDVGRAQRTATPAQRRALRAMYSTCGHPDCTVGFTGCKVHHIRWWWRHQGRTDLNNLIPLCEGHHHLVHEGRWTLTMSEDRATVWSRPDGTIAHRGPPPARYTG